MRRRLVCWVGVGVVLVGDARAQVASAPLQLASREPAFFAIIGSHIERAEARSFALLREHIALHLHDVTIAEALKAIEAQTSLRFAFKPAILPSGETVLLDASDITVAAALTQILLDADVDVEIAPYGLASLVPRNTGPRRTGSQTGTITGRITDAKTHNPILYANVSIDGTGRSATTNDSGTFRVANVPPGTYALTIRRLGYVVAHRSVTLGADQVARVDCDLELATTQLEQVVVSGTVTPTAVKALPTPITVVSDSDIAQQQPHTITELFREYVPTGVSFDPPQAPYSSAMSARGSSDLSGSNMKVLIDGVEATNGILSAIDPSSIARMEVIRGPEAAAIYGSGAIQGVVSIFTKRGESALNQPRFDAQVAGADVQTPYAGFRGVMRQNYSADVRQGSEDASFNLGGSYTRTDNYEPQQENSAMSAPSVFGGVHYARGITALDLSARYLVNYAPQVANPALFCCGITPVYYSNQYTNSTVGATLTLTPISWWRSAFVFGYDQTNQDGVQRRGTPDYSLSNTQGSKTLLSFNTSVTGQLTSGVTGTLTAGADHWTEPYMTTSGYEAFNTIGTIQEDSAVPFYVSRTVVWNNGGFAQAQIGFWDALFVTAGLRGDWNSDFGDSIGMALSPRVGASLTHNFGFITTKVRSSWGSALLPPAPTDKDAQTQPGYIRLANPTLGPEHQRGGDGGFDLIFGSHGSFSATYYNQRAVNLIQQVALPALGPFTNKNENIGTIQNYGLELEGSVSVWRLSLRGVYGYSISHIDALAPGYTGDLRVGDQAMDIPKNTGGATLSAALLPGTRVSAGLTYVGSWRDYDYVFLSKCFASKGPCPSDFNTIGTRAFIINYPSFVKGNLNVTQQITPLLSAFVTVDNVGDVEAHEGSNLSPAFGRITTVGFRISH